MLKKLKTPPYTGEEIITFLESEIHREGVFSKKDVEFLERVMTIQRPFRMVRLKLSGYGSDSGVEDESASAIDEDLAGSIPDTDHQFLLWRPRLTALLNQHIEEFDEVDPYPGNEKSVKRVLDQMLSLRLQAQEDDEELRPMIRSLQSDPLTSIAFVVPRSPGGIRREEKILAERKEGHSYILASSLVTNSKPAQIIHSAEVGERIYVETVVAEYRHLGDNSTRLMFLETAGSSSLGEAKKAAGALTRICQLYSDCKSSFQDSFSM
ncbi:MAG: hypothetical protein ACFFF9_14570 [Candidatus Thorarchaeota archaeon]